jgi:hypothetical protein
MAEHHASVTVDAPVHQVYELFTHFNDFPRFMSFVKEVTYYDEQNSHWVAEVVGQHEWDAVKEDWLQDQHIGWVSTSGLKNSGSVTFKAVSPHQTLVDVLITYDPPAGVIGDIGEILGAGDRFEAVLRYDLDNFAEMVRQAPAGALDPTSSSYLFHSSSAAAKGTTTDRQDATMTEGEDPKEGYRPVLDRDIIGESATGLPSGRVPQGFPEPASDTPGLPDATEPRDPGAR